MIECIKKLFTFEGFKVGDKLVRIGEEFPDKWDYYTVEKVGEWQYRFRLTQGQSERSVDKGTAHRCYRKV